MQIDYLTTIYSGIVKKKNIRDIHNDIRKVSKSYSGQKIVNHKLEDYAIALANKTKKRIDVALPIYLRNNPDMDVETAIAELTFDRFEKEKAYQNGNSINYQEAQKEEAKRKENMIKDELKKNREEKNIFYLASSHNDCAIDHKDYQGKMYIDEMWESIITDANIKTAIRKYIRQNNVKNFQWVIDKPVWFITRPNCRHFFKSIRTNDVLTININTLIKNHKMHSKVGKKETQTLRHPVNKKWYTKKNVEDIIKKYKDRLLYHKKLYQQHKSPTIARAIDKDKLLIEKWEKYLHSI